MQNQSVIEKQSATSSSQIILKKIYSSKFHSSWNITSYHQLWGRVRLRNGSVGKQYKVNTCLKERSAECRYGTKMHDIPIPSAKISPASSKFCQRYPCRWWFQWVMKYSQMHNGKTMEGRKPCCETNSQIERRPDTSNQSNPQNVRQLGAVLKISGDWKHPYGPANNDTLKNLVSDIAFYTASVHN